jgi:hypothetical protein
MRELPTVDGRTLTIPESVYEAALLQASVEKDDRP